MLDPAEARALLASAEVICAADEVNAAVARVANEITAVLGERCPLVIAVMGGAVVFAGHLLTRLRFPLDLDYVHATRYRDGTTGGEIVWKVRPREDVRGRVVLVVDDILDAGFTLAAIRSSLLEAGAAEVHIAVFCEKQLAVAKPVRADFIGLTVPDRFVFGFGMDIRGAWRNLPAVYAAAEPEEP